MKIISHTDAYADSLSTAAFSTIPFVAIGIVGHPVVLYVSAALGITFLCAFLTRFFIILNNSTVIKTSGRLDNIVSMMQLPYAAALAGMIFLDNGFEAEPILWLSLILAIAAVAFGLLDSGE